MLKQMTIQDSSGEVKYSSFCILGLFHYNILGGIGRKVNLIYHGLYLFASVHSLSVKGRNKIVGCVAQGFGFSGSILPPIYLLME